MVHERNTKARGWEGEIYLRYWVRAASASRRRTWLRATLRATATATANGCSPFSHRDKDRQGPRQPERDLRTENSTYCGLWYPLPSSMHSGCCHSPILSPQPSCKSHMELETGRPDLGLVWPLAPKEKAGTHTHWRGSHYRHHCADVPKRWCSY